MKKVLLGIAISGLMLNACKKDVYNPEGRISGAQMASTLVDTGASHLPLTVVTIAGAEQSGYVDGAANSARFNYLNGLDLLPDGTIYLADAQNNKIRKFTPGRVVSTVNIPPNNEGHNLFNPNRVRVQKDGTINIFTYDAYFVITDNFWIVKSGGTVITPRKRPAPSNTSYNPYLYNDLQKNPNNDKVYIGGIKKDFITSPGVIDQFELRPDGYLGTNPFFIPLWQVPGDREITSFFIGYNNVKYIVLGYNKIYASTPIGFI